MKYKIVFKNQSIESAGIYNFIMEDNLYLYLTNTINLYKVNKKTLKIKGIKEGVNGYKFDVPTPIQVINLS